MTGEWRVRVDDDIFRDVARIVVARRVGDFTEYVGENGERMRHAANVVVDPVPAFEIPRDALNALVEALHQFAPHKAEIARIEDALKIERGRVDRLLDKVIGS